MPDATGAISIGLISDTHFADRLWELPERLAEIWSGVDLILHAGDVGELAVLDLLGQIAPVVAVHGNDEPEYVKQQLPGEQLIALAGQRVLLWHSHYPDPVEEKANRPGPWEPKLARIAGRGQELGASVVVYGHTHVPMIIHIDGVLLVNPGALAAGSYFSRQAIATIARLTLTAAGDCTAEHFDTGHLANQSRCPFPSQTTTSTCSEGSYQTWLIEPNLVPVASALGKISYDNVRAVVDALRPLYRRSLASGLMLRRDLIEAITSADDLTLHDRSAVLAAIGTNNEGLAENLTRRPS
jgi:putative phosphoesterase